MQTAESNNNHLPMYKTDQESHYIKKYNLQ